MVFVAHADLPAGVPFQGRITAANGSPLSDGGYFTTFRLYDQPAGGVALWQETKTVPVARGVYSTVLGDTNPFPPALTFDHPYYLSVEMPGDAEMTPRFPLGAAPYARVAETLSISGPPAGLGSPLAGLAKARTGHARQQGSHDTSGGNADFRTVDPGQTITLFDAQGAGILQRFWCTIAPRADLLLHCQSVLRMYWDGETTPSVEVPVGAFFGVGFGQQIDFTSLPLNETSGGYNCYWEMPFHKSARWTLTNMSTKRIDAFYYNIDYTSYDSLPGDLHHFHAQWRRENPTSRGKNYTVLDATGRGQFVGTALFMQNRQGTGLGFLEGDEMMYMDGETTPSVSGTGTEDYFSSGWYYDHGTYSAPYHGCIIKDTTLGRVSTYRWHVEDAKPFATSIRVTIEHGTNNDTECDYSSVAYWYQAEPHAAFPAFPTDPSLLLPYVAPPPYQIPNAIEGESLVGAAQATAGAVSVQEMTTFGSGWSGGQQLWWQPTAIGARLTLHIPATTAGTYALTGYFTRAKDYGKFQVKLGAINVGAEQNFYGPDVVPTGAVALGTVTLAAGDNPLVVEVTGKDAASTGFLFGLDALVLSQ
jgi:hypothetical protein